VDHLAVLKHESHGTRGAVRHDLPGVGCNLQDHPSVVLEYDASDELIASMRLAEQQGLLHDECTIAKARSPWSKDLFDMHIFSAYPAWYA
jgi:hypothetical protein